MILYFYINMMAKKMTGAYKLLHTIILLITEILDFTFQVIRKVILPTSRRKGNVLSSLLFIFVGLVERALTFEKNILPRPIIFKYRYVKQALMFAVGFLFLLSSIEWTVGHPSVAMADKTQGVIIHEPADGKVAIFPWRQANASVQIPGRAFTSNYFSYNFISFPDEPVTSKKW